MYQTKTVRKQCVWQSDVGRVRAAVWEFERLRIFNPDSDRAVEGPVFTERAVVLNIGQQPGVWLGMTDVRSVREVLDQMDEDALDVREARDDDKDKDLASVARQTVELLAVPELLRVADDQRVLQLARVPRAATLISSSTLVP